MDGLMKGKRGLIMGVANDHSIAWGIAKKLAEARRRTGLHLSGRGVRPARQAARRQGRLEAASCPATSRTAPRSTSVFETLGDEWGGLDFVVHAIGFSDKNELKGLYADTTPRELHPHHGDLLLLLHRGRAQRGAADERRRLDDDADLCRVGAHHAELQCHGRRQGRRWRPACAISPTTTARAASASTRSRPGRCARSRAPASPMRAHMFSYQQRNSPLRRTVTIDEVGGSALYLLSDLSSRRDRRDPLCRFRLSHRLDAGARRAEAGRRAAAN